MDFINSISDKKFPASNIEIDDGYQVKYGDFSFETGKFDRVEDAIALANRRGYNVTVWVYPFANHDSLAFTDAVKDRHFVWNADGKVPAVTSW